jgi:thioredoxin-related protein
MKKVSVLMIALFLLVASSFTTSKKKDKIEWLTMDELQTAYQKEPRPVLFDVYTHWCGWCKVMDKETYSNENVINYINQHYYAVKFDAETKDSVFFAGKKYGYIAAYKTNEFAAYLTYNQLSFPTTVFVADMNAQPAPLAGYLKPNELEPPLKFFGDGFYKSQNYPEYIKKFSASW